MQILINVVVTFVLMFWPIMLMMSPMMFDAPGSQNSKGNMIIMMLVLSYPIFLFLLLWALGGRYFGMSGLKLAVFSAVVVAISFSVFGYFGMLSNLHKGISNTTYSVASNKVYFKGKLIKDADSQSFKMLDDEQMTYSFSDYALDKQYLYCNGTIVEGAVPNNLRKILINNDTYWLNDTQVIYDGSVLQGANPVNFGGFEGFSSWTHSVNAGQYLVFSHGVPLSTVDRATFSPLDNSIAKDKQHIFKGQDRILPGADVATFELQNDHDFGKDKYHVYYLATKLPFAINAADPGSFAILQRGYVKDKTNVYVVHLYESIERLEQADAASFEATQYDDVTQSEARDANHYYFGGKVVGDRKLKNQEQDKLMKIK